MSANIERDGLLGRGWCCGRRREGGARTCSRATAAAAPAAAHRAAATPARPSTRAPERPTRDARRDARTDWLTTSILLLCLHCLHSASVSPQTSKRVSFSLNPPYTCTNNIFFSVNFCFIIGFLVTCPIVYLNHFERNDNS